MIKPLICNILLNMIILLSIYLITKEIDTYEENIATIINN